MGKVQMSNFAWTIVMIRIFGMRLINRHHHRIGGWDWVWMRTTTTGGGQMTTGRGPTGTWDAGKLDQEEW